MYGVTDMPSACAHFTKSGFRSTMFFAGPKPWTMPFHAFTCVGGLEAFVVAEQQHHRHADLDLRKLARA